jgi:hypothetical protein
MMFGALEEEACSTLDFAGIRDSSKASVRRYAVN